MHTKHFTKWFVLVCLIPALIACKKDDFEDPPEYTVEYATAGFTNPYNYHLRVNSDKKLYWRDNNTRFPIIQADSPEPRLRSMNRSELDTLVKYGINTITCTMFGGDATDIHPYNGSANGFGNPASGFNRSKLLAWRSYFLHFANLTDGRYLIVAYLSERENHFSITEAQAKTMIDTLHYYFGDLSIMWQREEFPEGRASWVNNVMGHLKQVDQLNLVGLHGLTNETPWFGHSSIIDIGALQTSLSNADNKIRESYNAGFAVFAMEKTGGFGTTATNDVKAWAAAGGGLSSGAGIYIASYDLQSPTGQTARQYRALYKTLAQELGGETGGTPEPEPPSGNFTLSVSLSSNRSNPVALNGFSRTSPANLYVFLSPTNQTASNLPVKFYVNNAHIISESALPYDMKGGNASSANPYYASNGTYTVQAKNNSGQLLASATFTIGSGSTPTPPPGGYSLMISMSGNRSNPVALNGYSSTGAKNVYIFLTPTNQSVNPLPVKFYVNNVHKRDESTLPYDLGGGTTSTANPYYVNRGTYTVQARNNSGQTVASATFTIN